MALTSSGSARWERRAVLRTTEGVQLRSADRAQRVVAAVRDLATERGSTDFTMVEVATASGVPLRTLYRQFPGRDELLLALLEEEARLGAEILHKTIERVAQPSARLEAFVLGLWDFMVTGSGYASVLVREHLRLAERHADETRACLRPLVDLMVEAMDDAGAGFTRAESTVLGGSTDALVTFSALLAHMQAVLLFCPEDDRADAAAGVWELFRSMTAVPGRVARDPRGGNRDRRKLSR